MLKKAIKGSIVASFFLLISPFSLANYTSSDSLSHFSEAQITAVANDPLWHLLLQLKNSHPIGGDNSIYIGQRFVSALDETKKTLHLFKTNVDSVCSYPARLRLIQSYIPAFENVKPKLLCKDYKEFLESVPADKLKLIYASENVTSASSMMGHIMLRMDGINNKGLFVKHGITFFTELDSLNVPKIMYNTLVTGKEGVFKVAPYEDFENFYLYEEQRNIWSYALNFSTEDKRFLQDFIWELGQQSPKYFFHIFNCATVTQLLVNIARPGKLGDVANWLTPLDVVKFAENNNLISSTEFTPSNKWKVTNLQNNLDTLRSAEIAKQVHSVDLSSLSLSFVEAKYAEALNQYLRESNQIAQKRYEKNAKILTSVSEKFPGFALDVSEYPVPTDLQNESYLGIGYSHVDDSNYLKIRSFPVARRVEDDNRGVIGETELILADLEMRVGVDSDNLGTVYLDKAMLYQMISRIPVTQDITNLSSSFNIGINRVLSDERDQNLVFQTEFGVGLTKEITKGVGVYSDVILGAGANKEQQYLYVRPVFGAYIYTKFNNKLSLQIERTYNQYGSSQYLDEFKFGLHQYGISNAALDFNLSVQSIGQEKFTQFEAILAYRF
ncbi:hypothetical protein CW735_14130 [Alteromonas sp. MB-3u-76]|uniref:lipoprotein N-acyltransferase Lnb domain-containing protein n=1 Tax=Alteromonas sp. MB-3u-76 TaxID=2058133 RepID=UPI000C31A10D|nr:DUF4105 domain-containing protein [Alteromonas sp. MB-3u-76]AUC89179.1 hypothetical protein CW735_14130 [Alteromonas sp. MB-3u-76]